MGLTSSDSESYSYDDDSESEALPYKLYYLFARRSESYELYSSEVLSVTSSRLYKSSKSGYIEIS